MKEKARYKPGVCSVVNYPSIIPASILFSKAMSIALNAGKKPTMELVKQFQSLLEYNVNQIADIMMDPQSNITMKTFATGSGPSSFGNKMKELDKSITNYSGFVNDLGARQLEQKKEMDGLNIERADVSARVDDV
ncbi:hypothetical protein QBC40DRAFT_293832 [Triangularia verruculosa]|uniref:Uncharacterized protein n=1 Tax=Triangularia verruculosa TaxID=2587418 RepID=A0AAN7AYR2_9PEZI|nr:hypothetical protein QBC40DRAFT_293832 [Triangularia verruculosa]